MKINIKTREDITILEPIGKATIDGGDIALRQAVIEVLDSDEKNILINLAGVSKMDSSGIGELVSCYTTTNNRGGKLKLCCLPNKIIQILQITQLITVFEIYHEEDEAVASFI